MKTITKSFLAGIFLLFFLQMPVFAQELQDQGTEEDARQKVIAVVLDDSTSMIRDDKDNLNEEYTESDYTTRWIEADYAVRALAAMMNPQDILKVYPLGGKGNSISLTIDGKGENTYKELYDGLDEMAYYGSTAFDTVESAAKELKKEQTSGKECFLIVITDGNFKNAKNGRAGTGTDFTQKQLDEKFAPICNMGFEIKYIQIGESADNVFPSNHKVTTYKNTSEGVTRQITDVINEIYDRVSINQEDKASLIKIESDGTLTADFDIPMKSITIFLQNTGGERSEIEFIQSSSDAYELSGIIKFEGTSKKPEELWKSTEILNKDWIKYREMNGAVLNYTSPAGAIGSITVNGLEKADIKDVQIYYEPAVEQKITIGQGENESFLVGASDCVFAEGEINLTVEYVDYEGETLEHQDSCLLKTEGVRAKVNDRDLDGKQAQNGVCTYSGSLEKTDTNIQITNQIGIDRGEKNIPLGTIYEPYIKLATDVDTDRVLVLDENGCADLILKVWNVKDGVPLTEDDWNCFTEFTCKSDHFNADCKNYVYNEDGSISIPVWLKEPEEHQISKTEKFVIDVYRNYSDGIRTPASVEGISYNIEISSHDHELSASIENISDNLLAYLLPEQKLSVTYCCDGKDLSDKQKKRVSVEMELDPPDLEGVVTCRNGDIYLEGFWWKWLGFKEKNCSIKLTYSYTKWNKTNEGYPVFLLNLPQFSPVKIFFLVVLTIVTALILLYAIIKSGWFIYPSGERTDYISWNTRFSFEWPEDNVVGRNMNWGFFNKFIFRLKWDGKRCICLKNKRGEDEIRLYIKKNITDNTWKVCTHKRNFPLDRFLIGGIPVSENNSIFGTTEKKLEIKKDGIDFRWFFVIEEPEN